MLLEPPTRSARQGLPRSEIRRALALLVVAVGVLLLIDQVLPPMEVMLDWATARWPEAGSAPLPLFVCVATFASMAGLSRQGIAMLGGYLFGIPLGVSATLGALLLSAMLVALGARACGRRVVERRLPSINVALRHFGATDPFAKTLAIRLLPIGSNLVTNVAAGIAGVALAPFLLASALGYAPQTLVFALAGHGVQGGGVILLLGAVPLLVLSVLLAVWIGRRVGAR